MSRRTEMLGSTIQRELAVMILRDLQDPRLTGLPTITRVKVSTDLSIADVYVTIMGTEGHQQAALNAHKPAERAPQEPLWALVRGAMSYDVPDSRVEDAIKVIQREFVDLNELRVATELEVQDLLGQRYPQIEERVKLITAALNAIFEKEHTLSLDRLKTVSRRDAREFLRRLPAMKPFAEP